MVLVGVRWCSLLFVVVRCCCSLLFVVVVVVLVLVLVVVLVVVLVLVLVLVFVFVIVLVLVVLVIVLVVVGRCLLLFVDHWLPGNLPRRQKSLIRFFVAYPSNGLPMQICVIESIETILTLASCFAFNILQGC